MNIREDQLEPTLKRGIAPCYWIISDDAFLRDELEGKLIKKLLSQGFESIERRHMGIDFSPQQFFHDTSHLSLFSTRKILSVRSDKALDAALGDIFLDYLKNPAPDICLLLNSARATGVTQWQQKLTELATTLTLWPPSHLEFPGLFKRALKPTTWRSHKIRLGRSHKLLKAILQGYNSFSLN